MGEGLWPDCEGLAHCFPKPTTPLIKPRVRKRAQKTTPATTDAAPPEILKVELISLETPQVIYPCSHPSLQFGAVNGAGDLAAITVTCSVCGKQGVYTLTVDPQQVSWQQS